MSAPASPMAVLAAGLALAAAAPLAAAPLAAGLADALAAAPLAAGLALAAADAAGAAALAAALGFGAPEGAVLAPGAPAGAPPQAANVRPKTAANVMNLRIDRLLSLFAGRSYPLMSF